MEKNMMAKIALMEDWSPGATATWCAVCPMIVATTTMTSADGEVKAAQLQSQDRYLFVSTTSA